MCSERRGVCRAAPGACPPNLELVCGCDGVTYANQCERLRAGARPELPGDCSDAARNPPPCGGPTQAGCPAYMYCYQPNGTCGEHGETGFCAWRPLSGEECDQTGLTHLRFVAGPYGFCGCDGRVYADRCEAGIAGVSLRTVDGRDCAAP